MKRRLKGSYTVEAAFVMAIVLWAVLFSVQAAYRLRDETVGAMALHGAAAVSYTHLTLPTTERV